MASLLSRYASQLDSAVGRLGEEVVWTTAGGAKTTLRGFLNAVPEPQEFDSGAVAEFTPPRWTFPRDKASGMKNKDTLTYDGRTRTITNVVSVNTLTVVVETK